MSFVVGMLLFVAAILAAIAITMSFLSRKPRAEPSRAVAPLAGSAHFGVMNPETRAPDALGRLLTVQPGETIITATDDYLLVRGVTRLGELTQVGGADEWTPTGREFLLAQYDDEAGQPRAFAWLPTAEGGELRLYRMSQENAAGWTQFLAGTDDKPGPARAFADLDQRQDLEGADLASVRFSKLGATWQMTDIGQASYRSQGKTFLVGQGELRFALAQAVDGQRRLLFIDFLQGGTGSTDGLLVGDEYGPDLIKDIRAAGSPSATTR